MAKWDIKEVQTYKLFEQTKRDGLREQTGRDKAPKQKFFMGLPLDNPQKGYYNYSPRW